ncbi:hypothetical protein CEXT_609441 [Caerostris extrusa]|uniref:Homeobox domain-containing protein n=1 Tax=Caerostris extrusa TaxID=172846 RepID=A0AAV4V3A6_CAEEX|nr:hypothetical protein CEXT_609441 [Caerostris extrusa]
MRFPLAIRYSLYLTKSKLASIARITTVICVLEYVASLVKESGNQRPPPVFQLPPGFGPEGRPGQRVRGRAEEKHRRNRTTFTTYQLHELERALKSRTIQTCTAGEELAMKVNLPEVRVQSYPYKTRDKVIAGLLASSREDLEVWHRKYYPMNPQYTVDTCNSDSVKEL